MAAGQTVAEMQMEVQPWQPMPKMEPVAKNKVKVTDNVKEGVVRFAGNNFDIVFDRKTGSSAVIRLMVVTSWAKVVAET